MMDKEASYQKTHGEKAGCIVHLNENFGTQTLYIKSSDFSIGGDGSLVIIGTSVGRKQLYGFPANSWRYVTRALNDDIDGRMQKNNRETESQRSELTDGTGLQ